MDPDSSSAPLREGYDDEVRCADEADILIRTRDLISETLDKHDSQNCDSNEGTVHHTPCVQEGDGKIAMEEGKRENQPVVVEAHDIMAISSQITHQMLVDEEAISIQQEAWFVVKLKKKSNEHLLSAEELDSGHHELRSDSLGSAILIESGNLPKEEAHDQTILERIDDVDNNQTILGEEGLRQSTDTEAAFSREKTAVLIREDNKLAVKTIREAISDPYYFSDSDEQTADAESKLVTERGCSSQVVDSLGVLVMYSIPRTVHCLLKNLCSHVLQYYHDPVSGRQFRSKNEVMEYLERGTLERVSEAQVKFKAFWSECNSKISLSECTWQTPQSTDTGISILQPFVCMSEDYSCHCKAHSAQSAQSSCTF